MSINAVSSLVPGSAILTRERAAERGYTFHECVNEMTGQVREVMQRPVSGLSYAITDLVAVQQSANGARMVGSFAPTDTSLWRKPELEAEVAEDLPLLAEAVRGALREAGIDTDREITFSLGRKGEIVIGGDHPQRGEILALLDARPDLAGDIRRVASQSGMLGQMRVVEAYLATTADADRHARLAAWKDTWEDRVGRVQSHRGGVVIGPDGVRSTHLDLADRLIGSSTATANAPSEVGGGKLRLAEGMSGPDGLMRTVYGEAFDPVTRHIDGKRFQEIVARETAQLEADMSAFLRSAGLSDGVAIEFGIAGDGSLEIRNDFPGKETLQEALAADPALANRLRDNLFRQRERDTFAIGAAYADAVADAGSQDEVMAAWRQAVGGFAQNDRKSALRWEGGRLSRA